MSETYITDTEKSLPLQSELLALDFRYDLEEVVSQGGEKNIYRARDVQTNRYVALAQLREEFTGKHLKREAFLREARLNAALQHPNIMPVYDLGFDEKNEPFFTMRLMKGQSLDHLIEKRTSDLPALLTIFIKVCDAISYTHSKGIAHLDLKPDNIMIGKYGEVIVADWGISKIINEEISTHTAKGIDIDSALLNSITATGVVKGTPGYLAPEQMEPKFGRKNEKTDIFSLGAILFKILTGKKAIRAQTLRNYKKQLLQGVKPPSKQFPKLHLDKSLEAVCMKAMALNPNNRYISVKDIISDIQAFQNGYMTTAENSNSLKQSILFIKRNKVIVTTLSLVITSIIVFMGQRIASLENEAKLLAEKEKLNEEVESTKSYFGLTIKKNLASLANSFGTKKLTEIKEMYDFLEKEASASPALKIAKFKILFIEERYSECITLIEPEELKENLRPLYRLAEKYENLISPSGKLPIKNVIELMKELNENDHENMARQVGTYAFHQSNKNKIAQMLTRELLLLNNDGLRQDFDLKVDKRGDSYLRIEMSDRKISSIKGIQLLPVTDLNIRETSIRGVKVASTMPLRKLIIGKKVVDLRLLENCKTLKTLVLPPEVRRPHVDELRKMGIEVIFD